MPLGHSKGTELPTLRERLLRIERGEDNLAMMEAVGADRWFANPDGPEAAAMLQTAAEALRIVEPVLAKELDSLLASFTNRIGPHTGKVTDPEGKRWVAEYRKALKVTRATLERLNQ